MDVHKLFLQLLAPVQYLVYRRHSYPDKTQTVVDLLQEYSFIFNLKNYFFIWQESAKFNCATCRGILNRI